MDSRIRGFDPGQEYKHVISLEARFFYALCGLNVTLDSSTHGFDPGHKFKQRFHQICLLLCSLWNKNNGPLDSRIKGFHPACKFKHVISSNMPSFFAHCGFNVTLDSRIRGFDPGHKLKHVISSDCAVFFLLTVDFLNFNLT